MSTALFQLNCDMSGCSTDPMSSSQPVSVTRKARSVASVTEWGVSVDVNPTSWVVTVTSVPQEPTALESVAAPVSPIKTKTCRCDFVSFLLFISHSFTIVFYFG